MLPIITVGLTDASVAVTERIAKGRAVAHYATAEEAGWSLDDGDNDATNLAERAPDGRWHVHVVYGDHAFGPILAAPDPFNASPPVVIPATGLISVITDTLGDDQSKPRRVVEGQVQNLEILQHSVQVLQLLSGQHFMVVDRLDGEGQWVSGSAAALERLDRLATQPRVDDDPNAGADAVREQRRLNTLISRGQTRTHGEGLR